MITADPQVHKHVAWIKQVSTEHWGHQVSSEYTQWPARREAVISLHKEKNSGAFCDAYENIGSGQSFHFMSQLK